MEMGKVFSLLVVWPSTVFPYSSAQPTPLHWCTFLLTSYSPQLLQLPASHTPLFWLCPPPAPSFPGFITLSLWFPRPCLALSTPLTSYSSPSPAWALVLSLQAEIPLSIFLPHAPLTSAPTLMEGPWAMCRAHGSYDGSWTPVQVDRLLGCPVWAKMFPGSMWGHRGEPVPDKVCRDPSFWQWEWLS